MGQPGPVDIAVVRLDAGGENTPTAASLFLATAQDPRRMVRLGERWPTRCVRR
jgi:hypothetical protein